MGIHLEKLVFTPVSGGVILDGEKYIIVNIKYLTLLHCLSNKVFTVNITTLIGAKNTIFRDTKYPVLIDRSFFHEKTNMLWLQFSRRDAEILDKIIGSAGALENYYFVNEIINNNLNKFYTAFKSLSYVCTRGPQNTITLEKLDFNNKNFRIPKVVLVNGYYYFSDHSLFRSYVDNIVQESAELPTSLVNNFEKQIISKYGVDFDISFDNRYSDVVNLNFIGVPRGKRGRGLGTQVMRELSDFADENKFVICLSLASRNKETGTTSSFRLRNFYRRFGFVSNRGRNKDYKMSIYTQMYRLPR